MAPRKRHTKDKGDRQGEFLKIRLPNLDSVLDPLTMLTWHVHVSWHHAHGSRDNAES